MSQMGRFFIAGGGGYVAEVITDAGVAVPNPLEQINILGGTNINTSAAGNTIRVNLNNSVVLSGSLRLVRISFPCPPALCL